MEITELVATGGHEQLVTFADASVGLRGMIAIHSTALGPSLGGIRFWHYDRDEDAITDVLRLSQAMSLKAAVAGLQQGGGKAVVLWDDSHHARTDEFRHALGQAVHLLGGRYLAAEDVGATQADMDGIAVATPWVTGVDPQRGGSGDPSPVTAWGVLHGMRAACAEAFGDAELRGRRIVIQGAGHVGAHLAGMLVECGARVAIADIDTERVAQLTRQLDIEALSTDKVIDAECDVLAPCALGAVLTPETVPKIKARVICGAANNQLLDAETDDLLAQRDILFAPDFVVNAGGIINIAHEWAPGGYERDAAMQQAADIEQTTHRVFELARQERIAPGRAAEMLGKRRIETEGAGRVYEPGAPSVMRDALLKRWERFRTH
jgi:leucine dehydrogenase